MSLLPTLRWTDLADILLVSLAAWAAISWVRRTRARPALAGLAILGAVYVLARRLGLELTASILQGFFAVVVLVLVVVFQDELRRIIERIGTWGLAERHRAPPADAMGELLRAVVQLALTRTGALIVVPGREPLERHLEGGLALDGRISEPLLLSLFDRHSPGHDGAVVLAGDRVARFGVHLPLSADRLRVGRSGTRHAAALGLAERSDALTVVVSEERGTISIAEAGELASVFPAELEDRLRRFLARLAPPADRRGLVRRFGARWGEALAAVALATAGWLFAASGSDRVETTVEVPVVVERLPAGWELSAVDPARVAVALAGPRRKVVFGDLGATSLTVDAELARLGRRTFQVTPQMVQAPPGLDVVDVQPRHVRIDLRPAGGG